ncbi:common plant regulatory factor 1-like isoform X1 [Cynara cardunculus var. scolymus]|uniref:common plant regulatory factor 1-like isoform X1 n=1 Tax=Cynara cardunculus var. scolymus TaxID=59895 RepID=UPI000D626BC5|nr:common plant regulatory factor 1-like isoform X1 [Cynara cardunculus var. scolymus]XP_024989073.1 common plant regulatory factor 1-like isoform X1 [Cynara cardunculus var. scolymus]
MGNSEEAKDFKHDETSSPSLEQQQTGHVYPDWAAMQAYYGPRMAVPPYFSSAVASGHAPPPYMWGPLQHMMPPYAAIYPHGGVYAHPGVTVAASPMHIDSPAKSSGNSDRGLVKKLKGFDGLAMSIGNDNGGSAEGGNDNGISQSGETEGSSEGSDGNTTEGAKNGRKRSRGGSSTSSEVGKTEQSDQLPSTNANGGSKKVTGLAVAPGKVLGKTIGVVISADSGTELELKKSPAAANMTSAAVTMIPSTAILQNERELKRERRKQSNRESARRSRLRKQAEAEELGGKVEALTSENLTLKSEINRLTVNSANLKLQNAKLLEKLKNTQHEEAREDPRPDKKGSSLSTANLLSRVDNGSGSVVRNDGEATGSGATLRQLLDGNPRADAVAAG